MFQHLSLSFVKQCHWSFRDFVYVLDRTKQIIFEARSGDFILCKKRLAERLEKEKKSLVQTYFLGTVASSFPLSSASSWSVINGKRWCFLIKEFLADSFSFGGYLKHSFSMNIKFINLVQLRKAVMKLSPWIHWTFLILLLRCLARVGWIFLRFTASIITLHMWLSESEKGWQYIDT